MCCRHGEAFLKDSRALTVSSISVVLTQLEETMLLFAATNARTPTPKAETIEQKSLALSYQPFRIGWSTNKVEVKTLSSPKPSLSDYVDSKWLLNQTGTDQNTGQMRKEKRWLSLQKGNEKAEQKTAELIKNW